MDEYTIRVNEDCLQALRREIEAEEEGIIVRGRHLERNVERDEDEGMMSVGDGQGVVRGRTGTLRRIYTGEEGEHTVSPREDSAGRPEWTANDQRRSAVR